MFGGVGFVLYGNVACAVIEDGLIVQIDPEKQNTLLGKEHTRPVDMPGYPGFG